MNLSRFVGLGYIVAAGDIRTSVGQENVPCVFFDVTVHGKPRTVTSCTQIAKNAIWRLSTRDFAQKTRKTPRGIVGHEQ